MDIKLTQKNSILKTAGKFVSEDINLTVDDSLVGGGSSGDTSEGYTLTLTKYNNASYPFGNTSGRFLYRINDGEWQTFGASPITIENVKSVDFKVDNVDGTHGKLSVRDYNSSSYDRYMYLDGAYGGDTAEAINKTIVGLKLYADLTLYLYGSTTTGGGLGD